MGAASGNHPSTDCERAASRAPKAGSKCGKSSRRRQWQEDQRHENQTIDHRSSDDLFVTRSAAKKIKPADHDNGQPDDAHDPLPMREKRSFREERLRESRPNDEQRANKKQLFEQVDDVLHLLHPIHWS